MATRWIAIAPLALVTACAVGPSRADGDARSDGAAAIDAPADAAIDAGPAGPCPAPAPSEHEVVVYGDDLGAGWQAYPFAGALDRAAAAAPCSGAHALQLTTVQLYDGIVAAPATPVTATRLRARVHVALADTWGFAIGGPMGGRPTTLVEPPMMLQPGWTVIDLPIPSAVQEVHGIYFEGLARASNTFTVDDLRLVTP